MVTLTTDTPIPQARATLMAAGHSRAPVSTTGHLDDVIGVARLRDLLLDDGPSLSVGDVVCPAMLVPDTLRVSEALRRFKTERQKFALVIAEQGTVEGIVTLQDLVDEVVGEIDETGDETGVRQVPGGCVLLPGTFAVHDLPDLGITLSDPSCFAVWRAARPRSS